MYLCEWASMLLSVILQLLALNTNIHFVSNAQSTKGSISHDFEKMALLFLAKKSPFRFQISLNFKSHVLRHHTKLMKRVIYTMINRNIDNQHSYNLNTLLKEETV